MDNNKLFTLTNYINLLEPFSDIFRIMDYKNIENGILLRHDVDFSIDLAYEFSRIEKENNFRSTYYILLTSDLYNPLSIKNKEKINRMIEEGFEIGLHFDPIVYGDITEKELELKFYNEIKIFESVFSFKVKSYSLHNPSIHGQYPNFDGIINAYNPYIFSDECYISDSAFSFRGKNPAKFIKKSEKQLVQFLTHPGQYFNEGKNSYEKMVNIIMNNYYKKLDDPFRMNKIYAEQRDKYKIKINEEL